MLEEGKYAKLNDVHLPEVSVLSTPPTFTVKSADMLRFLD
jgi:hypothetical protein